MTGESEPKWRLKPLAERLAFAYNNKLYTDVTILVQFDGKRHRFEAHKIILANSSSVLGIFCFGYKAEGESDIELADVDPQGVSYVMKQLYHVSPSPRKDIDRSILLSAYHASARLGMAQIEADLKQEILDHVITSSLIIKDDFWKILELSRILKLTDILKKLLEFAECNTKEVLRAKSLLKASPSTLKRVLELDVLEVPETEVLGCIIRWKKANLGTPFLEELVKYLLGYVRFRNFSSMDLCQFIPLKKDIMDNDEFLRIMMHLSNPTSTPLPIWCSTKFRRCTSSFSKDSSTAETVKNFPTEKQKPANLLEMYTQQKHTDICFIVGPERTPIKAHRNVLALGSIVFEKMFYGPLADPRYEIEVPTMHPEGFDTMLRYFYDDSHPDSLFEKKDIASKTLDVALKYGSISLKNTCLMHYTPEPAQLKTFWKQLELKVKQLPRDDNSLKQLLDYASKNTGEILDCSSFLTASLDAVACICTLSTFNIKEADLLNSVVMWLEQNSKLHKSDKSKYQLLGNVRFEDISAEEISSFLAKHSNILSKEDSLAILVHRYNKASPLPKWCHRGPK